MPEAMGDTLHPPRSMQVSQDGVAFEVVLDGDRILRLYADGRKNKGSEGLERRTRWDADKLVTETKVTGGRGEVKITETWSLAAPTTGSGTEASTPAERATEAGPPAESATSPPADSALSPPTGSSAQPSPPASRLAITTRLEGGPFEKAVVIRRVYAREPTP
jgi:hypothetical protein